MGSAHGLPVSGMVNSTVHDEWVPMQDGTQKDKSSFLSSVPDLISIPPDQIFTPSDFDDVATRIMSEDARINDPVKLQQLIRLRYEVYKTRTVKFHWDLQTSIESTPVRIDSDVSLDSNNEQEESAPSTPSATELTFPLPIYDYDLGSFVAVRPAEHDDIMAFSVCKICAGHRGEHHSKCTHTALV